MTKTCDDEGAPSWAYERKTNYFLELAKRKKFILKLAKALLAFGAPSHRIESQLAAAAEILGVTAGVSGRSGKVLLNVL